MELDLRNFTGNHLPSADDTLPWFSVLEAGWVHDENPKRPHAKLHSGKCSNGFFLCKRVLKFPNLREILAACLVRELSEAGLGVVDGVFGSAYSSITITADVGRLLRVPNYIVEKGPKDPNTGKDTMVFKDDDPVPEGSVLLQIEELVTTKDSTLLASNAIIKGNPYQVRLAKFVGVLVHRPDEIDRCLPDGRELRPFIERKVGLWNPGPATCGYCAQGSEPIPPKAKGNWARLTAAY